MIEKQSITVDELIHRLKTARRVVGGDAQVVVCVPYEQGPGWRYEYILDAHAHSGNVDIPITLNYERTGR